MDRLENKIVFMTAAGMGIGRASAIAMANEGATVFASDVDAPSLTSLEKESDNIHCLQLDVTDSSAIARLPQTVPTPDVVFNCAGYVHHGTLEDADDDIWEKSLSINVRSHARVIETFLPAMIENGGGSIINMASVVSAITGAASRCVYGATKGAVLGLTKAIARDYIKQGIRCNAVCPGTVLTPSLTERLKARGDYEQAYQEILTRQPTGKMSQPEDIAPIIVYLASDESKVATGQFFVVDGGWTI
ncbi:MAG: SDR family oxidoreductase [Acidiferrobacterales bacterium]|nr:SDR family oxidoreductase [Acidiferrobacterales bacterium]